MTVMATASPNIDMLDCGHEPSISLGLGTGTAYKPDLSTTCYDCAWQDIIDDILNATIQGAGAPIPVLYISGDWEWLTTWDGQHVARVSHIGARHPWAARYKQDWKERCYFNAIMRAGADEVHLRGVGGAGEYALCTIILGGTVTKTRKPS